MMCGILKRRWGFPIPSVPPICFMTFKEMCDAIPEGWFDKLEMAALRERGRRNFYEKNYADMMTYDRFVFINSLESEITWGRMDEERAFECLKKYDEAQLKN
jgi:hypothetical protein